MLPRNHPDRIQIAFADHRLVNNAGLILPATLAFHLGLGRAPRRANPGGKTTKLMAFVLARGDCIYDACMLRIRVTAGAIGCVVKVSPKLGTFLRSFRWGRPPTGPGEPPGSLPTAPYRRN